MPSSGTRSPGLSSPSRINSRSCRMPPVVWELRGVSSIGCHSTGRGSHLFSRYAGSLALFGLDHAVDHTPCPQGAGIDIQVIEGLPRVLVDGGLLRFQHGVVLVVDALALIDMGQVQLLGQALVVGAEAADEVPEVMAARFRLRRERRQEEAVDALAAVAIARPGPRERHADITRHHASRFEMDDLPAVDMTGLAKLTRPEWRRLDIFHPARHRYLAVAVSDFERVAGDRIVPDAAGMDIGLMGQVHEVIHDQPVIALQTVEGAA